MGNEIAAGSAAAKIGQPESNYCETFQMLKSVVLLFVFVFYLSVILQCCDAVG